MKQKFKIIEDLTSDVMFEAYGKSLKQLFQNAALALFSVICQTNKVKQEKTVKLSVKADSIEDLMFNWLQELIALVDIKEMFFSKFKITKITETSLKAEISGQKIQPELGETVVKALTKYKYDFKKTAKGFKVCVVLDI